MITATKKEWRSWERGQENDKNRRKDEVKKMKISECSVKKGRLGGEGSGIKV